MSITYIVLFALVILVFFGIYLGFKHLNKLKHLKLNLENEFQIPKMFLSSLDFESCHITYQPSGKIICISLPAEQTSLQAVLYSERIETILPEDVCQILLTESSSEVYYEMDNLHFNIRLYNDAKNKTAIITKLKSSQELKSQRNAAEVYYTATIDNDLGFRLLRSSGKVKDLFGISAMEVKENPFQLKNCVFPDDLPKFEALIEQVKQSKIDFFNDEFRIIHPTSGETIWINNRVTVKRSLNSISLSGIITDISDDRLNRVRSFTSVEFLFAIINTIPQPFFIKDENSKLLLANRAFCKLLNLEMEDIIGKTDIQLFPNEQGESFIESDRQVLSYDFDHFESRVEFEGKQRIFYVTKTLYYHEDINKKYIVGLMQDITERTQNEEALRQAHDRAQNATRSKSIFLASMSHEIRTPMNAILGMAELLEESDLSTEQQEFVGVIRTAGSNLVSLINDILDFSKIEAGFLSLEVKPMDYSVVVEESVKILEIKALEKNNQIRYIIPDGLPEILGDVYRLRQIILNLINNAIKYTFGGEIVVTVKILNENENDIQIKTTVADTGTGVAPEEQEKIFNAFVQGKQKDSTAAAGTGLGLSISRSLVEKMNGHMGYKNRTTGGSEFWFVIPAKKTLISQEERIEDIFPENNQYRILMIEDNPTNQQLIGAYLKKMDAYVEIAENGKLGLEKYINGQFDLILMDIQMPVMDGMKATELIRQYEQEHNREAVKIIAVTAFALSDDKHKYLNSGMDGFLRKPFKSGEFIETVLSVLKNKKT